MLGLLYRFGLLNLEKISLIFQNPMIILISIGFMSLQFLVFALRWKTILEPEVMISMKEAFKLHQTGQFFNTFIPGGVGGDVVKALLLSSKKSIPKRETLSSVVNDRILGLYFMICFSFGFLLYELLDMRSAIKEFFLISLVLFVAANVGLLLVPYLPKLLAKIQSKTSKSIIHKLITYATHLIEQLRQVLKFNKFIKLFVTTLIAQLVSITFLYTICYYLNSAEIPFLVFFSLCCFAFMVSAIPITPGGIGLGQAAFYVIFKDINLNLAENMVVAISLMQLFTVVVGLPGWIYFLRHKKENNIDLKVETE